MKTGVVLVFLLTASPSPSSEALAHELEFYIPAAQSPVASATKVLKLETGEPLRVALPPIAILARDSVLRARGVLVPVTVEPGAESYMPDPHLYRVVLDLEQTAQRRLQSAIDRYCDSGADLQIAVGGTIIGHVVLRGCGPFEAGVTFLNRSAAEGFARRFTSERIHFLAPTATTSGGEPAVGVAGHSNR